jgi:hypothetical protein
MLTMTAQERVRPCFNTTPHQDAILARGNCWSMPLCGLQGTLLRAKVFQTALEPIPCGLNTLHVVQNITEVHLTFTRFGLSYTVKLEAVITPKRW